MQTQKITGGLAVTATWEAREGEADAVADILARFAPKARRRGRGETVSRTSRCGQLGAVPVL